MTGPGKDLKYMLEQTHTTLKGWLMEVWMLKTLWEVSQEVRFQFMVGWFHCL